MTHIQHLLLFNMLLGLLRYHSPFKLDHNAQWVRCSDKITVVSVGVFEARDWSP